jgi:hypothetical protein
MSQLANERYGMSPAPDGLALVQELLNTIAIEVASSPDLLADLDAAQGWVQDAVAAWARERNQPAPELVLGKRDLARLRALRDQLKGIVSATDPDWSDVSGSVQLSLDGETGVVEAAPRGRGATWLVSAVLMECFLAQQNDTWRRLKTCRNPTCTTAFYDRTRNNNGVWHDVHICGNAVNLRASRARRRANQAL